MLLEHLNDLGDELFFPGVSIQSAAKCVLRTYLRVLDSDTRSSVQNNSIGHLGVLKILLINNHNICLKKLVDV